MRIGDTALSDLSSASTLFKALGDETRLKLVALLAHGELCVCQLERLLELAQPTVSRQLTVLRNAGVVEPRREGSWIHYRLAKQSDPKRARILQSLIRQFSADQTLSLQLQDVRRKLGPGACR